MKGFIEVHEENGTRHLINVNYIIEVIKNTIYTNDTPTFATDFSHIKCKESYDEIKALIANAMEG